MENCFISDRKHSLYKGRHAVYTASVRLLAECAIKLAVEEGIVSHKLVLLGCLDRSSDSPGNFESPEVCTANKLSERGTTSAEKDRILAYKRLATAN